VEIDKLLLKGVLKVSSPEPGEFISPIFLRPKPDGSHRVILNLKPFNDNEAFEEPSATCQPTSTPTAQQATPNGLSALRESFAQYSVSPDITKILMASWRVGTQKQYKTYMCIEKWLAFCHVHQR